MEMGQRILKIIDLISDLPARDRNSLNELLEHDEWGVALESLCGALCEEKIKITRTIFEEIKATGGEMELESSLWESLEFLIAK
ncbi:MafI family immunity protein [Brevibacillus panacihumi]|uniref:MafI family immunity protein n=1 Tax=Brevibacillus panacihumi TaxID=497735 RepID=UPI003D082CF9